MNKRTYPIFKASALLTFIVIGLISAKMYLPSVNDAIYQQPTKTTAWQLIQIINPLDAEGNPGATASGFLEIYFLNHTTTPTTAYNRNTTATLEGWADANIAALTGGSHAWANADNFRCELKYGTTFDIVVRIRVNKTNCWDGVKFLNTSVRCDISLTGFNTAGMTNINGTQIVTYNNTAAQFIWLNYYWQDVNGGSGAGYTINKGSPWTTNQISAIRIWAKY